MWTSGEWMLISAIITTTTAIKIIAILLTSTQSAAVTICHHCYTIIDTLKHAALFGNTYTYTKLILHYTNIVA
jgi:hypothetical protein